jgi:hypothetical protein
MDLFKISNFSFGWTGDCNGFVQQLRGIERVREWQRDTERRPVRREEIMLVTVREQRYVSEPIETKYLKFDCWYY